MTALNLRLWPGKQQVSRDWWLTNDGDPLAASVFRRHYSSRRYADGRQQDPRYRNRNLIIGPGEKLVLLARGPCLFAWRKFIDDAVNVVDGRRQDGVNNCIFRREGGRVRASELIRQANLVAWARWPGERLYTYIDPDEVLSTNPGYCYLMAGYRPCGWTKNGKRILEYIP